MCVFWIWLKVWKGVYKMESVYGHFGPIPIWHQLYHPQCNVCCAHNLHEMHLMRTELGSMGNPETQPFLPEIVLTSIALLWDTCHSLKPSKGAQWIGLWFLLQSYRRTSIGGSRICGKTSGLNFNHFMWTFSLNKRCIWVESIFVGEFTNFFLKCTKDHHN